jgi:hypothetical protein
MPVIGVAQMILTSVVLAIVFVAGVLVLSSCLASLLICYLLKVQLKHKSGQVRRLRAELLGLGQVREHWKRLEDELGASGDAGQRAWLNRLRAEGSS